VRGVGWAAPRQEDDGALTGRDDEELLRPGASTSRKDDPNTVLSDGRIRDLIAATAKDA
jgi:hypothetical protein